MAIELTRFDAAEHLTDPEDQAELIADAIESGDAGYVAHALGVIARARGMSEVAREVGVNRQALYRALSKDGNPTLETMLRVMKALHLRMKIEPEATAA